MRLPAPVTAVFLGLLVAGVSAQVATPQPDPAAHTVFLPYDAKAKPDLAKADRFYLDYAEFQRLWDLAKEARRPEKVVADTAAPEAFINTALYDAEVFEASLRIQAQFQIVSRGAKWAKLALPFEARGALTIGEVKLDGHAAALKDGSVLIEEPGAHTLEVTLEIATGSAWKGTAFRPPASAMAALRLRVPATDGCPSFGTAMPPMLSEASRDGQRVFTLPLPPSGGETAITRNPARRLVADAPPAQADTRASLHVSSGLEQFAASTRFVFAGTERRTLRVMLDPSLHVEAARVEPTGVVTWRKDGGKQFLDVQFLQPVAEAATVTFWASRTVGKNAALERRLAPVVQVEAVRETHLLELTVVDELKLQARPTEGIERVSATLKPEPGSSLVGAWRLAPGLALPYAVTSAEARSLAKLETLYQLNAQKAEIVAAITLDSGRAPLAAAQFGVPAGFEVQALTGPRLVSWQQEGEALQLRFDTAAQREARVLVHLAKTLAQPTATWALEPIRSPEFAQREETVLLAAHAADDVKLTYDTADRRMRELDAGSVRSVISLQEPLRMKRALRVEKPDWSATVTLARQAPRYSVDSVLLAQASDLGLRLSQLVGVNVEQGAVSRVKVQLPASLPEARVSGAAVRDAPSRVNGAVREYEVTLQTEALERADFTLDFDLPLEGAKVLPMLDADGATRVQRFVIVDNAGAREMKLEASNADAAVKGALPYLPEGLMRPQIFRARDRASITLAFTQLESTAGNAAIITLAEITTALRPNGDRWDTAVYSLSNRSLQFLPVRLPERAELVEVSVGGQTVRADRGKDQAVSGKEFLVPLIQMRAGELSQQVRLVYRIPASDGDVQTMHRLDDPELLGLSAERTLWNVWVPEGYEARRFDGNMEEIGEDGNELEKQQSLLSEVTRLNRVLSSREVSYDDAKMAQDNADKALKQIRKKVDEKRQSFYSRSRAAGASGKEQAVVSQLDAVVSKQLEEQGALLTENKIDSPVFSQRKQQFHDEDDGVIIDPFQPGRDWNFNRAVTANDATSAKPGSAQADSTLVNDHATVSNGFFKTGNGTLTLSGGITAQGNRGSELQSAANANITLNNARGNNFSSGTDVIKTETATATRLETLNHGNRGGVGGAQAALADAAAPAGSVVSQAGLIRLPAQLKPVGRVSLTVEVPLDGTAHHFRKLKDHAQLHVTLQQRWNPGQRFALGVLIATAVGLCAGNLVRRQRGQRPQAKSFEP
ncbi:MAG: hypothetical protein ACOYMN_00320 [Roseimicrobium sp.]